MQIFYKKNKVCLPIDRLNIEDVFVKKTFYTRIFL